MPGAVPSRRRGHPAPARFAGVPCRLGAEAGPSCPSTWRRHPCRLMASCRLCAAIQAAPRRRPSRRSRPRGRLPRNRRRPPPAPPPVVDALPQRPRASPPGRRRGRDRHGRRRRAGPRRGACPATGRGARDQVAMHRTGDEARHGQRPPVREARTRRRQGEPPPEGARHEHIRRREAPRRSGKHNSSNPDAQSSARRLSRPPCPLSKPTPTTSKENP